MAPKKLALVSPLNVTYILTLDKEPTSNRFGSWLLHGLDACGSTPWGTLTYPFLDRGDPWPYRQLVSEGRIAGDAVKSCYPPNPTPKDVCFVHILDLAPSATIPYVINLHSSTLVNYFLYNCSSNNASNIIESWFNHQYPWLTSMNHSCKS